MEQQTISEQQMWDAVQRRDTASDGRFCYGVMTTGVYCRPSCASRLPLRKNVRFYRDADAAERDGLRPCKRCEPQRHRSDNAAMRSEEHTSELQSLKRNSYAVFCLKKKK